jgi:hypothetical protein
MKVYRKVGESPELEDGVREAGMDYPWQDGTIGSLSFTNKIISGSSVVMHTCSPSYLESSWYEPDLGKNSRPYLKSNLKKQEDWGCSTKPGKPFLLSLDAPMLSLLWVPACHRP